MKRHSLKKVFAFIITIIMFSAVPASVNAQKKCPDGHCPKGQICVNGKCVKSAGFTFCNCFIRPVPFECGQYCGWLANKTFAINSNTLSFQLMETQNVSVKIYDATGRLIKTLSDNRMPEGNHQIEWNKRDEGGNTVSPGIYILQFDAGTYSGRKKLAVIK